MNKAKNKLRCIHRHTIDEHPSCFYKGLIKYPTDKLFEKYSGQLWYNYPDYRIGYLDIEVDNLNADFGTVLSWCIKEKGGELYSSVITKKELFGEIDVDKRLVKELIKTMKKFKIIIGYNSTNFDLPYIRTKALRYNFDFPGFKLVKNSDDSFSNVPELFHFDLYFTVRSKLRLSSKSLANVCDYLKIPGKTPIDKDVWRLAKYGNEQALKTVLEHNRYDVIILEKLHELLEPIRKWIRTPL